jgi:hypothetical protein
VSYNNLQFSSRVVAREEGEGKGESESKIEGGSLRLKESGREEAERGRQGL